MVRGRRARAVNTVPAVNPSIRLTNGLDDHSCASPKRKDSKIEEDTINNETSLQKLHNGLRSRTNIKATNASTALQTGSQPITNYFNNIERKFTNVTINEKNATKEKPQATTDENMCATMNGSNGDGRMMRSRKQKAPIKLNNYSQPNGNSNCFQSNNIFLQEPVTQLIIDKDETQNASIVLKNSFLENGFSTLLTTKVFMTMQDSAQLYNRYNDELDIECVESSSSSSSSGSEKALDLTKPTQVTVIDSTTTILLNENSNDSGVVVSDGGQSELNISVGTPSRRRKPATPHRILCPSPVKTLCTTQLTMNKPLTKNNKIPKSRRKLEKKLLEEENERLASEALKTKAITYTIPPPQQFKAPPPTVKASAQPIVVCTEQQTKIDSFYPAVRKSVRKTKKEVEDERTRFIERAIREGREEGLAVKNFDDKGRGIVATRDFEKHTFVIEYIGDLISVTEANDREQLYAEDDSTGCYMYYFKHKEQHYCIDATAETGKLGRLVNHSRNGNLMPKTYFVNGRPHLVLIAKDDIPAGDELTYDYGDRSKEALKNHPWLAL